MKHLNPWFAALLLLLPIGCGTGYTFGVGTVTVNGLAPGQAILCGSASSTVTLLGHGFLSEHGTDVRIIWTAMEGTPFLGGTSATAETRGTVLSDEMFEAEVPPAAGTFASTVTVILPGGNRGTSPEITLEIGGEFFGPFAYADNYVTVGNVPLVVAAVDGVLPNDEDAFCGQGEGTKIGTDPSRLATLVTVTSYDDTTLLGGSVVMAPDGSFTYTPPLGQGFTAAAGAALLDSFTYTIEQPGRPAATATVSVDICDVVWFIDDTAPAGGDGSFGSPFDSLTAFNAQQFAGEMDDPEEGDWIFVYRGNSGVEAYDDGIVLKDDQKLIGQGVDLEVCDRLIVAATTAPVLTNTGIAIGVETGGPVVTLASGNRVRGLDTDGGWNGILGQGVSGPTWIDTVRVRNCNDSGIALFDCSGDFQVGDPAATAFPSVLVQGAGNHGLQIEGLGQYPDLVDLSAATAGGANALVDRSDFFDCLGNGIHCVDANLDAEWIMISDVETGIEFVNRDYSEQCRLDVINSNIGIPDPCRFRAMDVQAFGAGILADVGFNSMWSGDTAFYAQGFGIELALHHNDYTALAGTENENGVTPTVYLQGYEGGIAVTSLENNAVNSNLGLSGGLVAEGCLFDADPATGAIDTVPGGDLTCGNGPQVVSSINDTSLILDFCFGALAIDTFTVYQIGGEATGFLNTGGGLTLTITTSDITLFP